MIITQKNIDTIIRLTIEAHPFECCGLLAGQGDEVMSIHPSDNVSTGDKTKTFEIDAKVRFDLMRDPTAPEMIGFYHSHPNGLTSPSDTDKSMAFEPELLWLIATKKGVKAFRFNETKQDFEEVPIQVKL